MDETAFLNMIHENPFFRDARLIFSDWCDEHGKPGWADALRNATIPLVGLDIVAIKELRMCRKYGSEAKFARQIYADQIEHLDDDKKQPVKAPRMGIARLTPRQFMWLWILCRRYRRQITSREVLEAAEKRYEPYCKLLSLDTVPPAHRTRTKRTDDRAFYWDDV